MSLITEKYIICDGGCGETYGVDNRQYSADTHRHNMEAEGWKRINSSDYCPSCKHNSRAIQKGIKALRDSCSD